MAAARPSAVANSASAMPGATTARLVSFACAMAVKLCMMPHTVPSSPMNGEAEPTVARNGSPGSMRRSSLFIAARIERSTRARSSLRLSPRARPSAHSLCAAACTAPTIPLPRSGDRRPAAACAASWRTCRFSSVRRMNFSKMSAQQMTEHTASSNIIACTNGSACDMRPMREKSRPSTTRVGSKEVPLLLRNFYLGQRLDRKA